MTGFIKTICPACKQQIRIEVEFPAWNQGFIPKETTCPYCETHILITDPHEYNPDGTIKN